MTLIQNKNTFVVVHTYQHTHTHTHKADLGDAGELAHVLLLAAAEGFELQHLLTLHLRRRLPAPPIVNTRTRLQDLRRPLLPHHLLRPHPPAPLAGGVHAAGACRSSRLMRAAFQGGPTPRTPKTGGFPRRCDCLCPSTGSMRPAPAVPTFSTHPSHFDHRKRGASSAERGREPDGGLLPAPLCLHRFPPRPRLPPPGRVKPRPSTHRANPSPPAGRDMRGGGGGAE